MLNEFEIIRFFGFEIPMYGDEEYPLFLASDIADIIEYREDNIHKLLQMVDNDEKLTGTIFRSGQRREMWFLTEDGLYKVLMQSRKPIARQFKKYVKELLAWKTLCKTKKSWTNRKGR